MSAAVTTGPAVPVDTVARWAVALDHLESEVLFGLHARGVAHRLHDLLAEIRAARQLAMLETSS